MTQTQTQSTTFVTSESPTTEHHIRKDGKLFSFGVVADVQHARKPDATNPEGRVLYYDAAPEKLGRAIDAFVAERVSCVVNLGDAIDGNVDETLTREDLERVAAQFDRLRAHDIPTHHVLGNHCLSLPRAEFQERMRMKEPFYVARLADSKNWRLVVCDTNDLSLFWPEGHAKRFAADAYLAAHPRSDDDRPQMLPWNGGLGDDQLKWLETQLDDAARAGDQVIVASHHPLSRTAGRPTHCAWNWDVVERVLLVGGAHGMTAGADSSDSDARDRRLRSPVVRLALSGHDHVGGYGMRAVSSSADDETESAPKATTGDSQPVVHFVTVQAILETPSDAYAIVDVYSDRIDIRGVGTVTSRRLDFCGGDPGAP